MSGIFKLDWKDLIKGLVVSVLSAVIGSITQMMTSGFDWKQIVVLALSAGLGYLLKNLATDSDGKLVGKV